MLHYGRPIGWFKRTARSRACRSSVWNRDSESCKKSAKCVSRKGRRLRKESACFDHLMSEGGNRWIELRTLTPFYVAYLDVKNAFPRHMAHYPRKPNPSFLCQWSFLGLIFHSFHSPATWTLNSISNFRHRPKQRSLNRLILASWNTILGDQIPRFRVKDRSAISLFTHLTAQ